MTRLREELLGFDLRRDGLSQSLLIVFEGRALNLIRRGSPQLHSLLEAKENEVGVPAVRVLINVIPPGHEVPVHTDAGPKRLRLHYPVTQPVYIWDEKYGDRVFSVNEWSDPVPYWVPHKVWNPTDEDRLNVIVDFDKIVDDR